MKNGNRVCAYAMICLIVLLALPDSGFSQDAGIAPFVRDAMKVLALERDAKDLGVLTNARHVRLGDKTTEQYVDILQALTGCTIGKGNLLFFNERPKNSLLVILAHRRTMQSVVIRYDGNQGKSTVLSLKDEDVEDPAFFLNAMPGASGKQTFHIVSLLSAWFAEAPYEFLQCAELHGHVCPGVILGYLTAKGIAAQYALLPGEQYIFIASPNECKDDAIQVILGLTPGKRNLIVKPVDIKKIKNTSETMITGVLIKWLESKGKGHGVVVGVDLGAIGAVSEIGQDKPRNLKVLAVRRLLERVADLSDVFSVVKEFPVTRELKEQLVNAGTNPYVLLGMMPGAANASVTH